MLAAGAAEAIEQILRHVVAALDGDLLDGVGHVFHGDGDEALGNGFRAPAVADFPRQCRKLLAHDVGVERLVLTGAENRREKVRL